MEINQIVENLNAALQALSEMQKVSKPQNTAENYKKIENMARQHPFCGHILSKQSEAVQDIYITALLAIFDSEKDDLVKENQMLVLGRIIASYSKNVEFERYTVRCAKIGDKFWNDFSDFIIDDLKICFAVDAMLVFNMSHSQNMESLKSVADVMTMLGLDNTQLNKAASVARAIMTQNFQALLNTVESTDEINYTPFLCYFHGEDWNSITNCLSSAKGLGGKVIVAGAIEENTDETINLDEFDASYLYFYHCTFKRTCGIFASTVQSEFVNCIFQDNSVPEVETSNGWDGNNKQMDKNFIFLSLENSNIASSRFINCKATKSLICMTNGKILDCTFTECQGVDLPCSYLLQIYTSVVKECDFSHCRIDTDSHRNMMISGGIICAEKSDILKCSFSDCTAKGNSSGYAAFFMYILLAKESNVYDCVFNKCYCSSDGYSNKNVTSYILGMSGSKERGNNFNECSSYHYQYGDIKSNHDIGTV